MTEVALRRGDAKVQRSGTGSGVRGRTWQNAMVLRDRRAASGAALTLTGIVDPASEAARRRTIATMKGSLLPQVLAFVDAPVKTGPYASASEVVQDSLRLLEQERAVEIEKRDILKREVAAGVADAQAERFGSRTAIDIARDIIRASGRAS